MIEQHYFCRSRFCGRQAEALVIKEGDEDPTELLHGVGPTSLLPPSRLRDDWALCQERCQACKCSECANL